MSDDLLAEGRAVLEANAVYGVVRLGRWARANLGALLDELDSLRDWGANAVLTLAEDQRYIDEANSGGLVQRLATERDEARNAIALVQAAHEAQLTRLAAARAKAERKIARLTEEIAQLQEVPDAQ